MFVFYGIPIATIVLTAELGNEKVRAVVWTVAFLIMGVRCLANASGCGRVHCHFTGPWFLLAAGASLVQGLGVVDLGWTTIRYAALLGSVALFVIPEWIWGKHFEQRGDG
jgi:hypothetical protein